MVTRAQSAAKPASTSKSRSQTPVNGSSKGKARSSTGAAEMPVSGRPPKKQTCPGCRKQPKPISLVQDEWISCDRCDVWWHWDCLAEKPADDAEQVEKWYCDGCLAAASTSAAPLSIQLKPESRKSNRKTVKLDYSNFHRGLEPDPGRWIKVLKTKDIRPHPFKKMRGSELTFEWLTDDPDAMTEPILIEKPEGLGMRMPKRDLTVADVARLVGPDTPLEVIDVASQNGLKDWTLGLFAKYYMDSRRDKIRNVLSLEVSDTPLGDMIDPPRVVRQMDWLETIWPRDKRKQGDYPKVQKYCLMSVAQCWTDWHIDFAASSVFYHILRGSKTFFFIRPTPDNLKKYEKWSGSSDRQENVWLGDMCDEVFKIELTAGNTMIIPSGWIHAVLTPTDSLVLGGNFLHSLNIGTQLRLHEIEIATRVPKRYRYPQFVRFLWHVGRHYLSELTGLKPGVLPAGHPPKLASPLPEELTTRVLTGLRPLANFLIEQARRLNKDSDESVERKKSAKENVPWDLVKDPRGLASALHEAVSVALKAQEAAPAKANSTTATNGASSAMSKKRKAGSGPVFKNFEAKKPKLQKPGSLAPDVIERTPASTVTTTQRLARPVVGDEVNEGEEVDAEVRTTSSENKVVKLLRDAEGRVVRETRSVTTVVERVVWPVVEEGEEDVSKEEEAMDTDEPHTNGREATPPLESLLHDLDDIVA